MQRIFQYGDTRNAVLSPDRELKVLICRMPFYRIVCGSYKLLKVVQFFWPTKYVLIHTVLALGHVMV